MGTSQLARHVLSGEVVPTHVRLNIPPIMIDLSPRHMVVPRTARYYLLGTPSPLVRDVWIVCHGYGQLAARFAEPFQPLVTPSRLIVVPEALSRFYVDTTLPHTPNSAIGATWMTREDRDAEIADIVTYLDSLYDLAFALLASHGVSRDGTRIHALGFSQGAAEVTRWAARGAAMVDHLVLWGSGVPPDVNVRALYERRPSLHYDLVYGTDDQFVTPAMVAKQKAALTAAGAPYTVRPFQGGHTLHGQLLRELMG